MKKALLAMASCAILSASADAALYIVGDPAGEWNPAVGIEMTEADGGYKWTGTVGSDQWFAFATQLEPQGNWNVFNSDYRLNPATNGTVTNPGEYALELGGKDRAFKGSGEELTFFIKEADGAYTLTVSENAALPLPETSLYIIGQPVGDWSPTVGEEMEKIPGGWKWSGTVAETDYFAFATQLLDTPDWDTFNANYRISPAEDGTAAYDGVYEMHIGDPGAAFRGVGTEVTYIVREVEGGYTLAVSGAPEPLNLKWGVVGEFNGWGADPDFQMTEIRNGVWKATIYNFSGQFKFRADNNWEYNIGSTERVFDEENVQVGYAIDADGDFSLEYGGGNFLMPEEVEEVILELDLNNMMLTVDGLTPSFLALRGSFIDWAFEWSYLFQEVDDDVYMLPLDGLEAGWQFKIADQDWKEVYTTSVPDMKAGEIYPIDPDNAENMGVDNTYTDVTMFLNLDEGYICFYGEVATAVAANEIATGKARFFNLQGQEVSNPSNGVFIRVVNGKSEKITVK